MFLNLSGPRHPVWLKTFGGTLNRGKLVFDAKKLVCLPVKRKKIKYLAAPLGPVRGTPVENHCSTDLQGLNFDYIEWKCLFNPNLASLNITLKTLEIRVSKANNVQVTLLTLPRVPRTIWWSLIFLRMKWRNKEKLKFGHSFFVPL